MGSIFDREEELHHILELLSRDMYLLKSQLGVRLPSEENSPEEHTARRHYVRAVFALIEAMVEQHALLLLDLEADSRIELGPGVREVLSPRLYSLGQNGQIQKRDNRRPLKAKLRAVYSAAERAFDQKFQTGFSDCGWQSFQDALKVRHSLTHPKKMMDCYVYEEDLDLVDAAEEWYRGLYNDFTLAAHEHQVQIDGESLTGN